MTARDAMNWLSVGMMAGMFTIVWGLIGVALYAIYSAIRGCDDGK